MSPSVEVVILHPAVAPGVGPLERAVSEARLALAERHRANFLAAGADAARIVTGPAGETATFGDRLRAIARDLGEGGLVVLGSGAVPLSTRADRRAFVGAAAAAAPGALANNRYSADVIAIAGARAALAGLPDLASDNALPRWLDEVAGVPVRDLRRRWRLGVDIDGALDLVLLGGRWSAGLPPETTDVVRGRLDLVRAVVADPRAEVVVAGRTSPAALAWLERTGAARTRALVEERGMRTAGPGQRPPASALGLLLDRDGPASLGAHLARLGDAAIVDSRVLLAHRLGPDPRAWPPAEDRSASDLLLAERVGDPWLRALTAAAADAPIPVLLGGHTLVGPGLRLAVGRGRSKHDPDG